MGDVDIAKTYMGSALCMLVCERQSAAMNLNLAINRRAQCSAKAR